MTTPVPDETILGILASAPQHGYQIHQHFTDPKALGRIWTMSTSQIYAVLKRLESQGTITGTETTSQEGPPRKEYALTNSGHETLISWLYATSPSTSIRRIRVEFLSKLYIARLLNLPTLKIVETQRSACQNQKDKLEQRQKNPSSEIEALALEFVLGQLEAAIQWLDRFEVNHA